MHVPVLLSMYNITNVLSLFLACSSSSELFSFQSTTSLFSCWCGGSSDDKVVHRKAHTNLKVFLCVQ